jgi:hypothetical protein
MSKPVQTPENKVEKVPVDATYLWRGGQWLMQIADMQACKPAPKGVARLLDRLVESGELREVAPGLFQLEGQATKPVTNSAESPLFRLALTKQPDGTTVVDAEQFRAGERLREDYEKAHLSARITMNYDANTIVQRRSSRFSDNHISNLSDAALNAREELHRALEAVGPELSGLLLHVCCLAGGLEQAELRMKLPKRSSKALLQVALTRLARHYGFKPRMQHAGPAQIGHWALTDFKPQIPPPVTQGLE